MKEALNALLHSRKFLLLVLDTVIALILTIVGLVKPELQETVNQFILILQPVIIAVIGGIAYEDGKEKSAPNYFELEGEFEEELEDVFG